MCTIIVLLTKGGDFSLVLDPALDRVKCLASDLTWAARALKKETQDFGLKDIWQKCGNIHFIPQYKHVIQE